MNEEIRSGIQIALERGGKMTEIVESFVNAGYNQKEVYEAANSFPGNFVQKAPTQPNQNIPQQRKPQPPQVPQQQIQQQSPQQITNPNLQSSQIPQQKPQQQIQQQSPQQITNPNLQSSQIPQQKPQQQIQQQSPQQITNPNPQPFQITQQNPLVQKTIYPPLNTQPEITIKKKGSLRNKIIISLVVLLAIMALSLAALALFGESILASLFGKI